MKNIFINNNLYLLCCVDHNKSIYYFKNYNDKNNSNTFQSTTINDRLSSFVYLLYHDNINNFKNIDKTFYLYNDEIKFNNCLNVNYFLNFINGEISFDFNFEEYNIINEITNAIIKKLLYKVDVFIFNLLKEAHLVDISNIIKETSLFYQIIESKSDYASIWMNEHMWNKIINTCENNNEDFSKIFISPNLPKEYFLYFMYNKVYIDLQYKLYLDFDILNKKCFYNCIYTISSKNNFTKDVICFYINHNKI